MITTDYGEVKKMQNVYILDTGCLCSLGDTMEKCWKNLGKDISTEIKYEFKVSLPPKLKRSSDRFSKLFIFTMNQILEKKKELIEKYPPEKIGTIFASEYGPIGTNLQFAREVMEKDPDICSPARFSNTVANACVGIACMSYGYTGVSTMLQGSNSFTYGMDLIDEEKADLIFCGYAEEYNEEIFRALHQVPGMENKCFTENSLMFLIGGEKFREQSICSVNGVCEINLRCNAMVLPLADERNEKQVETCICQSISGKKIDGVIYTSCADSFGQLEKRVLKKNLPDVPLSVNVNELVGDTLGSSLNLNLFLGIMCMKKKRLSLALFGKEESCQRLLVTGYDIMGNYTSIVLEDR